MKKIGIICSILLTTNAYAAKSDLKSTVLDKIKETAQEETVSGATSEGFGFLRSLYKGTNPNNVRIIEHDHQVKVRLVGDEGEPIKVHTPRSGAFNVPSNVNTLTLPAKGVIFSFEKEARSHPYRWVNFPLDTRQVYDVERKPLVNKHDVYAGKYPLYVNTYPRDARVRVLNIGPKYQRGMKLASRNYKIEVSKKGYKKQVFNYHLDKHQTVVNIKLRSVR